MNDDLEIRERLAAFVAGESDPAQLEEWLHDIAWDLDTEPARTFVATALRLLAEFANGDWTEGELSARVAALSRFYWFEVAPKEPAAGSGAHLIEARVSLGEAADRQPVAASA
jgi:hypothetical protein